MSQKCGDFIVQLDDTRAIGYWMQNWWITSFEYLSYLTFRITIPPEPKDSYDNILKDEDVVDISPIVESSLLKIK
jgi:hypothetical protein